MFKSLEALGPHELRVFDGLKSRPKSILPMTANAAPGKRDRGWPELSDAETEQTRIVVAIGMIDLGGVWRASSRPPGVATPAAILP